jgi:Gram-negative bacterial TonB protein C-terminal
MRIWRLTCALLLPCILAFARNHGPSPRLPTSFEIGRRTFFDFGPPFDYYEIIQVSPGSAGVSLTRAMLARSGDTCSNSATIETSAASMPVTIADLFAGTNPCTIPERDLRRELKRCKKCMVFSGVNVTMQFQCDGHARAIRSDILDKDLFDPAPHPPQYTSWTMQILRRLDGALGHGAMDKPLFESEAAHSTASALGFTADIASGKYDFLFPAAPDKLSALYQATRDTATFPEVRLVSIEPFQPQQMSLPGYPPIAKAARVQGTVEFDLDVDENGLVKNVVFSGGPGLLRRPVETATKTWRFAKEAANHRIASTIEFNLHCASPNPPK